MPRTARFARSLPIANKHLDTWIRSYLAHRAAQGVRALWEQPRERHLLVAICDHFEPLWRCQDEARAEARIRAWRRRYPLLAREYRDADGRAPRHSFFFPGEQYRGRLFDLLAPLCRAGLGEVELHLHHADDDAVGLRRALEQHLASFASHGHLSRAPDGTPRYAFIHGNWALANARPDGRHCGVDDELVVLFETGCYADFTFPAIPDPSQPRLVNCIYWPTGDLGARRAHDHGRKARIGECCRDRILVMQGPVAISRRQPGFTPRLDYAALTAHDPATPIRLQTWIDQNIHVAGRPEWVFVKLHTHGAPEAQADSLLGSGGRALHDALRALSASSAWKLHYVTAREMFNVAMAAMAGMSGDPHRYRDFLLAPPPITE
jgi:hypothetical protein